MFYIDDLRCSKDVFRCSQIFTDVHRCSRCSLNVLRCSLNVLRCPQDVLNMFSGCFHYIKDTLVGLAGGPSASGGSCGSCVCFGYCGPGGPDESAWWA